ncbi:uncharacterized protein LOC106534628 [Austrofundulus limnaeus]|uniref:Uncharacterized protein LOC106534628 n=1 Tax=Austrofundulus limnaeus TaxID=52670 RepID=A0A2I4D3G8_AUSLI|nr:PREDICTED: uncharacterized protein LOC106534628 [Austrofundulus limnaeus]
MRIKLGSNTEEEEEEGGEKEKKGGRVAPLLLLLLLPAESLPGQEVTCCPGGSNRSQAERRWRRADLRWTWSGPGCWCRDIVARRRRRRVMKARSDEVKNKIKKGEEGGRKEAANWLRRGEESKWRFRRDVQTWTNFTPVLLLLLSPPSSSSSSPLLTGRASMGRFGWVRLGSGGFGVSLNLISKAHHVFVSSLQGDVASKHLCLHAHVTGSPPPPSSLLLFLPVPNQYQL